MKIIGSIEDIIFRNEQNNYTVLIVNANGNKITAVGKFPQVSEGLSVELEGQTSVNSKYGEQFSVQEVKILQPSSCLAIERYLSSGIIRGIGPATAKKIVDKFKTDTLTIIELNPMRLAEIKGISKDKAYEIGSAYTECKVMQDAVMFLQSHSISTNLALKIFDTYKNNTINQVKTNPYKLVEDIDGIGFATADAIAQKTGVDPMSEERIKAGILHCLKQASDKEGHTYLLKTALFETALKLLDFTSADEQKLQQVIEFMAIDGSIKTFPHHGEDIVISNRYYYNELYVARKLSLLSQNVFEENIDYSSAIQDYQNLSKITLNTDQINAVKSALNSGASVITGGPGTGKTTIVKCILNILEAMHKKVLLVAPTGRASKRLSESCGQEAKTIHRALETNPTKDGGSYFHRNENNPLDADVIIIDEMSMVDISLFCSLLRAVRSTARVVMVGDKDQLQSVGAGNVLRDIIESGKIQISFLNQIYRQDKDSLIIVNAHLINSGKMPTINNSSKDFFYEQNNNIEDCAEKIIDMVSTRLPNYFHIPSDRIQVLAPMRAGVCGIDNLNKKLQQVLNPYFKGFQVEQDFIKYHVGDKVMQIVNNYEMNYYKVDLNGEKSNGTGVYNGDIGHIIEILPNTYDVTVQFEDGKICTYPRSELSQLTLAYAITIHKSQGSEFDAVVIPIVSGAPVIITRNLLYTAITRAKKVVVLIGSKQNLARMIYNNYTAKRFTLLKDFLCDEFNKFLP